jgi:hypothetical protein
MFGESSIISFVSFSTPAITKTIPLRQTKLKAKNHGRTAGSNGGTETDDEYSGESSESYVDEGHAASSSRRRLTGTGQRKKKLLRRSWKSLNRRKLPQPRKETKTVVDDAIDVVNAAEGRDGDKDRHQDTVQRVILPAQDSLVHTDMKKQPPSSPRLRSSTVIHGQEDEQFSHLPLPEGCVHPLVRHHHLVNYDGNSEYGGWEDKAVERPASPSSDMVAALGQLMLPSLRMQQTGQLPFLQRNLRRGFANRCFMLGVCTQLAKKDGKPLRILLTFRLQTSGDDEAYRDEYQTRMTSWRCPLCDLHGGFAIQGMLLKHIEWDHSEVKTRWTYDNIVSSHWSAKYRLFVH